MADDLPPRRVLLVEGPDDKHVVQHLCRRHADMPAFDILDKGGFTNVKSAIGPEIKVSGRTALGILVDANRHPARRWAAVAHQLRSAIGPEIKVSGRTALGILVDANRHPARRWAAVAHQLRQAVVQPPTQMAATGTVVEGRPRTGVWLMPDNASAGELEDFIERLIPPDDPVWPTAQRYIDGIPTDQRKFSPDKVVRARIHAWLAARAEPRKMGAAIGAGDLDATAPLAIRVHRLGSSSVRLSDRHLERRIRWLRPTTGPENPSPPVPFGSIGPTKGLCRPTAEAPRTGAARGRPGSR